MEMQSWELMMHYIPAPVRAKGKFLVQEMRTEHFWTSAEGQASFAQAQKLAAEGWDLVTVVPETLGTHYGAAGMGGNISGYILFFKRPNQ
jgi:hypothetical protein